jgi:hypothetical protein
MNFQRKTAFILLCILIVLCLGSCNGSARVYSNQLYYSYQPLDETKNISLFRSSGLTQANFKAESSGSDVKATIKDENDHTISSVTIKEGTSNGVLDLSKLKNDSFTIVLEGTADKFELWLDSGKVFLPSEPKEPAKPLNSTEPKKPEPPKPAEPKEPAEPQNPDGGVHIWRFFDLRQLLKSYPFDTVTAPKQIFYIYHKSRISFRKCGFLLFF